MIPLLRDQERQVVEMGKAELFSLSHKRLAQFIWDRYWKGSYEDDFTYYGVNPRVLSRDEAKKPATIFLHAQGSNQGSWLPMLHRLESSNLGPRFSINYAGEAFEEKLLEKIEMIRKLYLAAGADHVELNLVGHSLGATNAVDFGYNPQKWLEGVRIVKIVAIAGRLKNIEPPTETPYYAYCYDVLIRLDEIWERVMRRLGGAELFTCRAEEDWLIPAESIDLGEDEKHRITIQGRGHLRVVFSRAATDYVLKCLANPS
ncbi:MAG: hypothetical protein KDK48_01210 [Chlamydiia bacterium]|nr:hypothetical protein [Chlamydiia bacterium]